MSVKKNAGVPAALASHITYLDLLLKNLPLSLPSDSPDNVSTYHFYFDTKDVDEEGLYYAFNRCLEICFQTHLLQGRPITLVERGTRMHNLIQMFRRVAKEVLGEHNMLQSSWLDRLVTAAKSAGASIPGKRHVLWCLDDWRLK